MIIFRLGRCLLVGAQALSIFKENKITTHHPSHPWKKKTKTNPQKAKPRKKYHQTQQRCYRALYSHLCFDTKMNVQEAREEAFR